MNTPTDNPNRPVKTGKQGMLADLDPIATAGRQRSLLLRIVRAGYVVLLTTVTLLSIIQVSGAANPNEREVELATNWWIPLGFTVLLAAAFLAADLLTPNKKLQTVGGVILGLVAGLLATLAFSFVVDLVAASWDFPDTGVLATAKVILGISLCYLGVSTVLQTQDDFRLSIPYIEFSKQIRGQRAVLLDSSVLIDARIADVAETGIIQAPIVIPSFVIDELQLLADSSDKMKRARGRRGLEVVARLQRSVKLDVSIDETQVPGKAVDQMLVELARRSSAMIASGDTALARIAGFQNVPILNLHELANALKPAFVSGEVIVVKLVRGGEQAGQGVGYLDDGTMVIAEDGQDRIGRDTPLSVRSTLQTAAGRLVFARVVRDDDEEQGESRDEAGDERPVAPPVQVDPPAASTRQARTPTVRREPSQEPRSNPLRNPRRS
jgi:uncharacterized protein YacL